MTGDEDQDSTGMKLFTKRRLSGEMKIQTKKVKGNIMFQMDDEGEAGQVQEAMKEIVSLGGDAIELNNLCDAVDSAIKAGVMEGLEPLRGLKIRMKAQTLTIEQKYQELLDRGLIQTPLQRLIEYNVTNGCSFRERKSLAAAFYGLLSEEDESLLVMNKEKVFSDYRRQK